MYAFYDSMKIDKNLQYDFLPINVKKSQDKQNYKDEMASHLEAKAPSNSLLTVPRRWF